MIKVVVIGSGNVAYHLINTLQRIDGEFQFVGCYARKAVPSAAIASLCSDNYFSKIELIPQADIYIVSVSDDVITEVIQSLKVSPNAIILHTSGTKPIDAIDSKFEHRGVLYPLQTFSTEIEIDMKIVPFFIESNLQSDRAMIEKLATALGNSVTYTDSYKRKIIHIAAVFSCNFTNHMYAISQNILRKEGLEFSILEPLIKESTRKALVAENILEIQTGPAAREDFNTINEHKKMLSERIEKIYEDITNSIIKNGEF